MDSSVMSYKVALEINEKINYQLQRQCWDLGTIDYVLYEMGSYAESLEYAFRHLSLCNKVNDTFGSGLANLVLGHDFRELSEFRQSLNHYFSAKHFFKIFWENRNRPEDNTYTMLCIAATYLKMNQVDSALVYTRQAYQLAVHDSAGGQILLATRILGDIYYSKNDNETALMYYRQYIPDFVKYKERNRDLGFALNGMAKAFQRQGKADSAVYYARKALENANKYQDQENIYTAATILYHSFNERNRKNGTISDSLHIEAEAYKYFKIVIAARDSMTSIEKLKQVQLLSFNEQVREKQQAAADAKETARRRLMIIVAAIIFFSLGTLLWYRIRQLRLKYKTILEQKEIEKLKTKYEKDLLELEAKALRAQMNPHFIFNCLNSIKSLIQQHEEEKAVTYLTIFSKLIRTLFINADKKEISLYDEIETCKLYLQLEAMRFDTKFSFAVEIDNTIDLKSIQIPALIIQPFLENAIWHGIIPRNTGGHILFTVFKNEAAVQIVIEDNGIGREASQRNRSASDIAHQSRGVNLTQSRLELNNLLLQRQATIETIDKKDAAGNASGTKVIIKINEEL